MKNKNKVSIIVPVYNIENYISTCLESLVNQSYQNIEIIVIDDGSSDNSSNIVKKFQKNYSQIHYYKKNNGGLSSARNFGLKKASGEFVMFVDGDDFLNLNAIEIMIREIENNDILCFNYINKIDNKEIKQHNKYYKNENTISNYIIGQPSACTKFYKRSIFEKNNIKFDEGIIYEDLAIIPSLALYTDKIKFIDDTLYYYVIRKNSIMHSKKFSKKKDDKFIALDLLISRFKNNKKFDCYSEELEYVVLKSLATIYSMEILIFSPKIYKPRINKLVEFVNKNYPEYEKNKYFIQDSKKSKIFIDAIMNKRFFIAKIITLIAKTLNKL